MNGNCFCGSVSYVLSSMPEEVYYCHCRDCQRLGGSAFQVLGVSQNDTLSVLSGELSEFSYHTDRGSVMIREFCPTCGSSLFLKSSRFPEIRMFTVSTLEQPEKIQPSFEIWTTSKLSWSEISEEIESFPHGASDTKS